MSEPAEKKNFTIRFTPESADELHKMSNEVGVSSAELVRRAITFYQVRMDAKRHNKRLSLESADGVKEWVVI